MTNMIQQVTFVEEFGDIKFSEKRESKLTNFELKLIDERFS